MIPIGAGQDKIRANQGVRSIWHENCACGAPYGTVRLLISIPPSPFDSITGSLCNEAVLYVVGNSTVSSGFGRPCRT